VDQSELWTKPTGSAPVESKVRS